MTIDQSLRHTLNKVAVILPSGVNTVKENICMVMGMVIEWLIAALIYHSKNVAIF
jgi:hypothetical protein